MGYLPSPRLLSRGLPPLAALTVPWVTSPRRAYCPVVYLPSPRLLSRGLPPLAALTVPWVTSPRRAWLPHREGW